MNGLRQVLMAAHPAAVAPDVDDVATVQQPVQQGSRTVQYLRRCRPW